MEMAADPSDRELVTRLAGRDEEALRLLHRRYASLVFTVASRVVDAPAAEEVVQDVFMTIWRKPESYDPEKGALASWLRRVARNAALNVRRRDSGAAREDAGAELQVDDALPADEALWSAHRRSVLRAAVDALPAAQRDALSLAYFDELTQEQVAAALRIPVGTTKTRIRLGLRRLATLVAAAVGMALLYFGWRRAARDAAKNEAALVMVTSSDVVPIRLEAVPGVDPAAHATFRARKGVTLAVMTASHLPAINADQRYAIWARHGDSWLRLGALEMREDGGALTVLSPVDPAIDELQISRESTADSTSRGDAVVAWSARGH